MKKICKAEPNKKSLSAAA